MTAQEILFGILGIIIGIIVTWLVAHIYYKKSVDFFSKFSDEVKDAVLSSNKEKFTVKELNELLEIKTRDPDSGDPLPYTACPRCGSEDLKRYSYSGENDVIYSISCPNCGWEQDN